jgi:hypothetical protein
MMVKAILMIKILMKNFHWMVTFPKMKTLNSLTRNKIKALYLIHSIKLQTSILSQDSKTLEAELQMSVLWVSLV